MNRQNGFSLMEMIISLMILGMVLLAGSMGLSQVIRSYLLTSNTVNITQDVQAALERISTDLTHIHYNPPANLFPPPGSSSVDNVKTVAGEPTGYLVRSSSNSGIDFLALFDPVDRSTPPNLQRVIYNYDQDNRRLTVNGNVLLEGLTTFVLEYYDDQNIPVSSASSSAGAFDTSLPGGTKAIGISLQINRGDISKSFATIVTPKYAQ